MRSSNQLVTGGDYDKAIQLLESLALKGEGNLTKEELSLLETTARMVEAYEEQQGMQPIQLKGIDEKENSVDIIAKALGYEPGFEDLVRFKMLQLKINQKELSALLNMTESKVSQILSGKRDPDIAFLKGIHKHLHLDGNILLETA